MKDHAAPRKNDKYPSQHHPVLAENHCAPGRNHQVTAWDRRECSKQAKTIRNFKEQVFGCRL